MELKDRLSQLRKTKGVSLAALGTAVGINRITISRYEKGERKPKYEQLEKLAAYFGVSVPYLMGIDDNEEQQLTVWSEVTGIDKNKIKDALDALPIRTDNLETDIKTVVATLSGLPSGTGNQSGVAALRVLLTDAREKLDGYFKAPNKSTGTTGLKIKHAADDERFLDKADIPLYRFIETALTEIPRIAMLLSDNGEQSQLLINEATQRLTNAITDAQQSRSNDIKKDATQTDDAK